MEEEVTLYDQTDQYINGILTLHRGIENWFTLLVV